ncbi:MULTISPECIES: hypothetical protein [unclassified Bradyrhizobium]|uniref:hypothetical protein n=1 Tax=unclassified Bradyrhizobium TaxID=2631580 RepID=UPI0020B2E0C0|nr:MULTISPECIES: hypothetical protein [unclassified Bradyrhizobium]MCP3397748.1 hypothetical protein [Bradyrhizobium sp. CCGB20]MCP3406338.1 hypothetical protein [Bradyrhizobium sp. CCGB01]
MSEPTNNEHIGLRRHLAFHEAELIARSREQIERSPELLRQPMPSTFVGEQRPPSER